MPMASKKVIESVLLLFGISYGRVRQIKQQIIMKSKDAPEDWFPLERLF